MTLPPTSPTIAPKPSLKAVEQVSANDAAWPPLGAIKTTTTLSTKHSIVIASTVVNTNLNRGVISVIFTIGEEAASATSAWSWDATVEVIFSSLMAVTVLRFRRPQSFARATVGLLRMSPLGSLALASHGCSQGIQHLFNSR